MRDGGELRDLYQEVVLEHSRRPRNHREMPDAGYASDYADPEFPDRPSRSYHWDA